MKKRKIVKIIILTGLLADLLIACDMRLKTVVYSMNTEKVSRSVRLALITDLHSCWYGKEQKTLIDAVEKQNPDIVLLGGDIFDDKRSYENAETTLQYLSKNYPCYYVTGNHEYWSGDIENILEIVESYDVTVLRGGYDCIQVNGQEIQICGIDDPDMALYTETPKGIGQQLEYLRSIHSDEKYTILLAHRPELAETYMNYQFDLVLTGHAHGGQWRIPGIINGLYAPDQGFFPKYAGGLYELGHGKMIVSRGCARESTLAPRIFNRPELVIVEINPL